MIIASSDLTGCNKWGEVKVTSWESFIFHHRLLCFASSLSSKHSIIDATHQTITSHRKERWKVSINTCEEECWFRQGRFFFTFLGNWIISTIWPRVMQLQYCSDFYLLSIYCWLSEDKGYNWYNCWQHQRDDGYYSLALWLLELVALKRFMILSSSSWKVPLLWLSGLALSITKSGLSMWENLRERLYTSELISGSLLDRQSSTSIVMNKVA